MILPGRKGAGRSAWKREQSRRQREEMSELSAFWGKCEQLGEAGMNQGSGTGKAQERQGRPLEPPKASPWGWTPTEESV